MSLTRKQSALVHVAKKQIGLTDDEYRGLLRAYGGVDSSRDLDTAGLNAVLRKFEALGFASASAAADVPEYGLRYGMATPEQVAFIRSLWSEYTAGQGDDRSLGKWLARIFKVSDIRFVTYDIAPKAITALKAMVKRQEAGPVA